ncbi:archaellin/type IV pilin N-terminal domain-containing protein [Halanaeroarchaeum sulfurireducens]|uniref:Flagellin n=1 Tax=Halanaeroarchaeum sulfurireducens TaxID=1604004 RepID=A0A0F7PCC3_9EURY|nr:archaellin/type IV pilin N-terminal domain-containing protein [Halanaeroarchaeum sulfurireducens]AKH97840.1 flagellin A [Halanaeroarchaeum sulfurireducens]ALG82234.1 flagellin A [Halanaeroarchaeum sulfurireducens]
MFEFINDPEERGQVGIGTLIVFIAMVLVAAIAAGVLINTAGFLQTQAESTGEQSASQVSNSAQVVYASGNVSDESVDLVNVTVKKAPGSDNINLSKATINWNGDKSAILTGLNESDLGDATLTNFTHSNAFIISTIDGDKLGTGPVLVESADRLRITMNATAIESGLSPGQTVDMTLVTQSGAETTYTLVVPESLTDKQTVSL